MLFRSLYAAYMAFKWTAKTEGNPMGMSAEHDSMSCSGMSAQAAEAFVDMLCKTVQWQHAAITIKGTT